MSYRNPARIVDTQSGQHMRNMQQSLAKSFTNVIDNDTARLIAQAKESAKKDEELRKEIQLENAESTRTATQANKKHGTAVAWDNMYENQAKNARLSKLPPGTMTPEERRWKQNWDNVGLSMQTTLGNAVSQQEPFEVMMGLGTGAEGGYDPYISSNIDKIKQNNILFYGKGGSAHGRYNGDTNETDVETWDLEGKVIGRINSSSDPMVFNKIPSSKEGSAEMVKLAKASLNTEKSKSAMFDGVEAIPRKVGGSDKLNTEYFMTPTRENVLKALTESALQTVQSWTPTEQTSWNNTQIANGPDDPRFMAKTWTVDGKYEKNADGKMVPNENVAKIARALAEKVLRENQDLLLSRSVGSVRPETYQQNLTAQNKRENTQKAKIKAEDIETQANVDVVSATTEPKSFFEGKDLKGLGRVSGATITDGVLNIEFYTGKTGKNSAGEKTLTRSRTSFDLTDSNKIKTLGDRLYPLKGDKAQRDAFVNKMIEKLGENETDIGKNKEVIPKVLGGLLTEEGKSKVIKKGSGRFDNKIQ